MKHGSKKRLPASSHRQGQLLIFQTFMLTGEEGPDKNENLNTLQWYCWWKWKLRGMSSGRCDQTKPETAVWLS